MSLLNKASLIQIPSGYKDGTLYSAKPTNGNGDFTFSRGSNLAATRVNSEGLIEKGRENLIVYSQDFSNANWSTNASATISHGITDPNGGSTASRITFAANVNSGIYQQNPTLFASNNIRTSSLYMKGAVGGEVVMFGDATNRTIVTLTTSWVRYEGFAIDASTYFIIYTNTSSPSADTIDIAFVQYENGLVATDYIETTTTTEQAGILEDMPRLDYSGGATCPSLLLEPQRSNAVTMSEYLADTTNWPRIGSSVTSNSVTSPEGVQNASTLVADGTTGTHRITEVIVLGAGKTLSVFAKAGTNNFIQFYTDSTNNDYANFDLAEGVVGSVGVDATADIEDYGNGWYRCIMTTGNAVSQNFAINIVSSKTAARAESTSLSTNVYLYGAMIEAGSYPTSYIPTYGASVTRGADSCSKTGISSLIGQTEGTLFAEVNARSLGENRRILFSYEDGSNFIMLTLTNTDRLRFLVFAGGAIQADFSTPISVENVKVAGAYKANDFVFYVNGAQIGTDTSGSVPATSDVYLGVDLASALPLADGIKQALLFKTRLSNDELATLTTL